jgi:beta-lactam-binding protein with PASTA domain
MNTHGADPQHDVEGDGERASVRKSTVAQAADTHGAPAETPLPPAPDEERVVSSQHETVVAYGADPDPEQVGGVLSASPDDEQVVVSQHETIVDRGDGVVQRDAVAVEQRRKRPVDPVAVALLTLLALLLFAGFGWWYVTRADGRDVPAVEGMSERQAVDQIESDGLEASVTRTASDEPSGMVVAQSPEAGESVEEGGTVALTVSSGPDSVTVPNAVGLVEATARDRLVASGLEVTSRETFADRPEGTVIRQEPTAGADAQPGSRVVVVVSKGSGRVSIPSVVGLTVADAEAQLTEVELEANVVSVPSDQPEGTVVAQSPTGGQATKGDAIRLNVSAGR